MPFPGKLISNANILNFEIGLSIPYFQFISIAAPRIFSEPCHKKTELKKKKKFSIVSNNRHAVGMKKV